jgi:hypothetical protein
MTHAKNTESCDQHRSNTDDERMYAPEWESQLPEVEETFAVQEQLVSNVELQQY